MNSYLNKEGGRGGGTCVQCLSACMYLSVSVCVRACLNVILRGSSVLHVDQEI